LPMAVLGLLIPALGCTGPDAEGSRPGTSPSMAERRLYGATAGIGRPNTLGTALSEDRSRWGAAGEWDLVGGLERPQGVDAPGIRREDGLPTTLQEPWYSFPSPAPMWSQGLPGLPNTGLFGGLPARLR